MATDDGELMHASCVALDVDGGWRAVLIRGPSGSGKSDLALRMIGGGARLVADDQVRLTRRGAVVHAGAPDPIRGLIEVRGVGVARMTPVGDVPVVLVVDLVAAGDGPPDRLPEDESERILDCVLRRIRLDARESSAPLKVGLAAGAMAGAALCPL